MCINRILLSRLNIFYCSKQFDWTKDYQITKDFYCLLSKLQTLREKKVPILFFMILLHTHCSLSGLHFINCPCLNYYILFSTLISMLGKVSRSWLWSFLLNIKQMKVITLQATGNISCMHQHKLCTDILYHSIHIVVSSHCFSPMLTNQYTMIIYLTQIGLSDRYSPPNSGIKEFFMTNNLSSL